MAEKKIETRGPEPSTQEVVKLLTSILNEVQKQVQSKTAEPLEGEAMRAVEQFREISAALALQRRPTITLTSDRTQIPTGQPVNLHWSSTEARKVSIAPDVGEVTPVAGGSIPVTPSMLPTTYIATATGDLCGRATAEITITASVIL